MPPKRKRAADVDDATTGTVPKTKRQSRGKAASAKELQEIAPALIPSASVSTDPFRDLFVKYSDDGEGKVMTAEGVQKLFEDAGLGLEGASPFLLAWVCKAAEFAGFEKDEWERLRDFQIDSPTKLHAAMTELEACFYADSPIPPSTPTAVPAPKKATKGRKGKANGVVVPESAVVEYGRDSLRRLAGDPQTTFKEFYQFCFGLMKKPEARVMEMEMATATWGVTLQPKFPIMANLLEFIAENPSYRSVNKDLWTMTYEFCIAIQERSLSEWNDDESWPSLIDEFVAWQKTKNPLDSQGDVHMS